MGLRHEKSCDLVIARRVFKVSIFQKFSVAFKEFVFFGFFKGVFYFICNLLIIFSSFEKF